MPDPLGLRLDSLFFLDLDSDLLVPLMTLVIFWTVLSVIDSVLDSLGDLVVAARVSECEPEPDLEDLPCSSSLSAPLRKLADFLSLEEEEGGWGEEGWQGGSLARAPSSLVPVGGVLAAWATDEVAVLPDMALRSLLVRL